MKLYNCPYKGDMCFLYGNCEECAFYKSMEKNRNYRKTIKNLKKDNAELQTQVDELKKSQVVHIHIDDKLQKEYEYELKQAVKDTAKEIADWLITTESDKEDLAKIIKEHYGVEVE